MAWAALNTQLRELLPLFALPVDLGAAQELRDRVHSILRECEPFLKPSSPAPAAAEAQALLRTVCLAADQLLQLSASIHDSVSDPAMAMLVTASCQLAQLCALICGLTGLPPPPPRILACAQFLLRCGAAAQQFAALQAQRGEMVADLLGDLVSAQVWALEAWQGLIIGLPDSAHPAAVAEACAPPALLRQWAHQTLASLRLLAPPSWRPGTPYASTLVRLFKCLGRSCMHPDWAAHARELLSDAQLHTALLQQMLPAVCGTAVGLQLPPARRSQECTWYGAAHMAAIAASSALFDSWRALTDQPEAARRLLAAAAQLLQHCPFPAPSASSIAAHAEQTTLLFAMQLGTAAALQPRHSPSPNQQPSEAAAAPQDLQAALEPRQARQLLAVLPRISEALAAAAEGPASGSWREAANVTMAAKEVALLLAHAAQPPAAAIAGATDLPAWCRGAATVLRWLPLAATMAASAATTGPGDVQQLLPHVSFQLQLAAQALVRNVGRSDACWAEAGRNPAVRAECLAALWGLHTAACRLVHWVLAEGSRAAPGDAPPVQPDVGLLYSVLTGPLLAATHLVTGSFMAASPEETRCLAALAAAHTEALLAILGSCSREVFEHVLARAIFWDVATASMWAPATVGGDTRLQAALAECLAALPKAALLECFARCSLPSKAVLSPQLAAVLVAEGHLATLVHAAQASSQELQQKAPRLVVTKLVRQARSAVAAAASQAGAAAGDQAAELAGAAAELERLIGGSTAGRAQLDVGPVLPSARRLAAALLAWWRRPEVQPTVALEAAQAAAARSCAYLRCANLGGEGGPAAGQGTGSQRCSACRAVWYCGTACSHADWRAGHRRVCRALGAARAVEKERRRQAAAGEAAEAAPIENN